MHDWSQGEDSWHAVFPFLLTKVDRRCEGILKSLEELQRIIGNIVEIDLYYEFYEYENIHKID